MEFLEHYKVTPQGLAIAIDYHWNGRTLETIVNDDEAHAMLRDDLGIGSKLNRLALIAAVKEYSMPATVPEKATTIALIAAVKEYSMPATVPEKATTIGELIPQPQQRRLLLAGEKALEIPTIPVAAPGHSLPNHSSWKTFMTSVQGWSELESQDYSYVINCINRCPNQELDRLSTLLSDLDMRMDLVLGTHLFNKASAQLKQEFVQQEDYMLLYEGNHRLSGMKIIAFLGRKIVRQSTAKWLTLNREFTKRPPVYKMADLYKEINIILSIKDDLSNQDQCVEEATFFAVLHNAISELIEIPQLIVPFAMPIKNCEKNHGHSGTHLLACLRDLEFEITSVSRYKESTVPGNGDRPLPAAGGVGSSYNMPRGHAITDLNTWPGRNVRYR